MPSALPLFEALADPTRLRIMALLHVMELSVGELAHVLGQSQPRVSRHVRILVQTGLVTRRKEGNWVFLRLGEARLVEPALAAIRQWQTTPDPDMEADQARLAAVRSVRATEAEDWFEAHAGEWDAIRSLHVPEAAVEASILRLLSSAPVGQLADIGTGTGRMIELLGPLAQHAVGIDRSPSMLRLARSKLDGNDAIQVEWRQGDLYALPIAARSTDTVIMHQVLHYVQHPAAAIAEAARIMRPGGRLLVIDFAEHDCTLPDQKATHYWHGFTDCRMQDWFRDAGLVETASDTLEGGLAVRLWLAQRKP